MQFIIGHTTHNSSWIWVRGDRSNRLLSVELEALDCCEPVPTKPPIKVGPVTVQVDSERDYTGVASFDSVLKPNTPYKVVLSSAKSESVEGQLRTFPESESESDAALPFHFLHGSCNVPVARLTALGSMAAGLLGFAATKKTLEVPFAEGDLEHFTGWKRALGWPGIGWLARGLVKGMNKVVLGYTYLTRFEQPEPLLPSPFEHVLASAIYEEDADGWDNDADGRDEDGKKNPEKAPCLRPAFMIHCGDQIYYDLDFPQRTGGEHDYRRSYRQAWFSDEQAAKLLRSFPQYMILDDHEIVDGFGTDLKPRDAEKKLREPALRAYDEYVGSRQPRPKRPKRPDRPDPLDYTFEHGNTGFFVLNTRTERSARYRQMISDEQLEEFVKWLRKPQALKFVVSSVPFVAELRPPGLDRNGERRGDERADKWSGYAWQAQRERIIRAIYEREVQQGEVQEGEVKRLVFLVGDMHCTYHARMQIGDPRRRVTVHELAGGPVNQLQFATRDDFYARYTGSFKVAREKPSDDASIENSTYEELPWTSTMEAFHGAAPSVLKVSVSPQSSSAPLEIRWTALRTHPAPSERDIQRNFATPLDPHDLCGRIRFHRKPNEDA